jgi:hypothetical protein
MFRKEPSITSMVEKGNEKVSLVCMKHNWGLAWTGERQTKITKVADEIK